MRARSPHPRNRQAVLLLEPTPEQVQEQAEALMCRWYWRRRYRSLQQLQETDPAAAQRLLTCALGAARALLRKGG